jgi:hypothetical protein
MVCSKKFRRSLFEEEETSAIQRAVALEYEIAGRAGWKPCDAATRRRQERSDLILWLLFDFLCENNECLTISNVMLEWSVNRVDDAFLTKYFVLHFAQRRDGWRRKRIFSDAATRTAKRYVALVLQ